MIIGLVGNSGTGKDWVAINQLVRRAFVPIAFGDELKLIGIMEGVGTYDEFFNTKPAHIRDWMQRRGTEEGRDVFGQDCWIRAAKARMKLDAERYGISNRVFTDVRFMNEFHFLKGELGALMLYIDNPTRAETSILTENQREHVSESKVPVLKSLCDGVLLKEAPFSAYLDWQVNFHLERAGMKDPWFAGAVPDSSMRQALIRGMFE